MTPEDLRNDTVAGLRLRAALASGAQRLSRAGIDAAFLDGELLLGHVTAMTRAQLLSSPDRTLTSAQAERFEDALGRRLEREPVAYITGHREFWSLDFHVAPGVLIPRPETERLVEIALESIEERKPSDILRILEIGTGSGYQAAVLSPLVKEVYSIEIVEPLGKRAEKTLKRLKYTNVHTKVGDGYQGWAEHAPFDKVIVTCSPEKVPQPLVDQLRGDGLMVIPVGERYQQTLYLMRKVDGELQSEALRPTLFVPMTGEAQAVKSS